MLALAAEADVSDEAAVIEAAAELLTLRRDTLRIIDGAGPSVEVHQSENFTETITELTEMVDQTPSGRTSMQPTATLWEARSKPPNRLNARFLGGSHRTQAFSGRWYAPCCENRRTVDYVAFFVLSAIAIYYSLKSRNDRHFLAERFKRMIIPLIFGIFILYPPQVYIERITHAQFTGSFWQFLPHYFDGWYGFGGNFAWMGLHLWFLLLLFLFSLLTLPLLRYLKQSNVATVVLQKIPPLQGETLLVVFVVCTGIIEALVNLHPNGVGRRDFGAWSPFTYLVGFFLFGYLLAPNPQAISSFERNRTRTLLLALCTTLIEIVLEFGYGASTYSIPFSFLRVLNAWLWLATILGFGKRYLNFKNTLLISQLGK